MGVLRYLTVQAMCSMLNAYVYSITDYCIDIWTTNTEVKLDKIQALFDRFLVNHFPPQFLKKSHKRAIVRISINMVDLRNNCNFLPSRKDPITCY
jgi:hypothetical protein